MAKKIQKATTNAGLIGTPLQIVILAIGSYRMHKSSFLEHYTTFNRSIVPDTVNFYRRNGRSHGEQMHFFKKVFGKEQQLFQCNPLQQADRQKDLTLSG